MIGTTGKVPKRSGTSADLRGPDLRFFFTEFLREVFLLFMTYDDFN